MATLGKNHNKGRTNIIYWPTQILMVASAIALIARAAVLNKDTYAPATMFSSISMALAWVRDNIRFWAQMKTKKLICRQLSVNKRSNS